MAIIATYDRPQCYRGDTVMGWSVGVSKDGEPVSVESARLQLRDSQGRIVYQWPTSVSGSVVTMADIPSDASSKFPTGALDYDLEITLAGGRVVTWLKGTQNMIADRTR